MEAIHKEVQIVPWQEEWTEIFDEEKQYLANAFAASNVSASIYHVGSTSVKGMISKPILDILVCPEKEETIEQVLLVLVKNGYRNLGECGRKGRYFLTKGSEPNHTFYLHLCPADHPVAKDQLLFQHLEKTDPVIFQNYIHIKEFLEVMFPDDRNMYRFIKGQYVEGVLHAYRTGQADLLEQLSEEADDDIKYWIYEFDMPLQTRILFDRLLEEMELTAEEFVTKAIVEALKDPEKTQNRREMGVPSEIRLVRHYPVYKGETEAQAKKRKLAVRT